MSFADGTFQTHTDQNASPSGRATEFQAVEGGPETTTGVQLVVEAYAALWLLPMVMMFISWRRLSKDSERVAEIEAAVARPIGENESKNARTG